MLRPFALKTIIKRQIDGTMADAVAPAVDTFLAWHGDAGVILKSHQVAVRKRPA